jgi:glycosyltransferase 2 family protein
MRINTRYVKAVISLAFFVLLFKLIRKHDFLVIFEQFNPAYFLLSLLFAPVMIMTSCLKWKFLLDIQGSRLSFWYLMKVYFIGYYFSNILPSTVGGDVVRSYYTGRRIESQTLAAVSVFIERFSGLIFLLVFVIVCPFLGKLYPHPAIVVPALGAVGLLVIFLWMLRYTRPLTVIFHVLLVIVGFINNFSERTSVKSIRGLFAKTISLLEKLKSKADKFHEKLDLAAGYLKEKPVAFIWVVLLTIIFYMMAWFNVYLAFRTFNIQPEFLDIAVVLPTAMMVAMVPVTLGSLGIAESSYVYYFGLMGIAPAATLVMGLFLRFKMILTGIVGLGFYLAHNTEKIENVEQLRNSGS